MVNRTWAVQVAADQDDGWLRELFAPTFLDWLGQRSPEDFTFELLEGQLTCRVDGVVDDAAGLDGLCELTAHVAERIRTESLEEERPEEPFSAPLPPPEPTPEREAADRAVAKLGWDEPPKDMMSAARAYKGVARREPGGWKAPILLGGGIALLIGVFTIPFSLLFGLTDFGVLGAAATAIFMGFAAIAIGGFLFWAARRSQVTKRALRYGQRAFVIQYAAARGLEHEDAKAFHARFLRLELRGPGAERDVRAPLGDGPRDAGAPVLRPFGSIGGLRGGRRVRAPRAGRRRPANGGRGRPQRRRARRRQPPGRRSRRLTTYSRPTTSFSS